MLPTLENASGLLDIVDKYKTQALRSQLLGAQVQQAQIGAVSQQLENQLTQVKLQYAPAMAQLGMDLGKAQLTTAQAQGQSATIESNDLNQQLTDKHNLAVQSQQEGEADTSLKQQALHKAIADLQNSQYDFSRVKSIQANVKLAANDYLNGIDDPKERAKKRFMMAFEEPQAVAHMMQLDLEGKRLDVDNKFREVQLDQLKAQASAAASKLDATQMYQAARSPALAASLLETDKENPVLQAMVKYQAANPDQYKRSGAAADHPMSTDQLMAKVMQEMLNKGDVDSFTQVFAAVANQPKTQFDTTNFSGNTFSTERGQKFDTSKIRDFFDKNKGIFQQSGKASGNASSASGATTQTGQSAPQSIIGQATKYPEGQTGIDSATGKRVVVKNGKFVPMQ
jgi:hypothetical protein